MNKIDFLKVSKNILKILMTIQILLGIIFVIKNIGYMPEYGDSKEFLELAQTMELDSYRPFVYPLFLNISGKIANLLKTNITYIVYSVQIIVNVFASLVLVNTLKKIFNLKISNKEVGLYTLFILFIPFNIHFNMSIKCDSLASSFTILFLCYLIRYLNEEKNIFAIYTFLTMFIASNIRSERIYFLSFILLCIILWELATRLIKKDIKKTNTKKIIVLACILFLGIITTNISKLVFQDENANQRSQPTISMYLYERIVGNTLPDIYDYLPDDIKEVISYEEALSLSSDRNCYKLPYETLYEIDGNLDRANTIIKIAVRRNLPNVLINTGSDFIKNVFSPYYIMSNSEDWSYNYTLTKMEGEHYLFADLYVLYFDIIFALINIYVVLNIKMNEVKLKNIKEIIPFVLYSLISAAFFASLTSQNFHIRYVMPVFVIEISILTMLVNKCYYSDNT